MNWINRINNSQINKSIKYNLNYMFYLFLFNFFLDWYLLCIFFDYREYCDIQKSETISLDILIHINVSTIHTNRFTYHNIIIYHTFMKYILLSYKSLNVLYNI